MFTFFKKVLGLTKVFFSFSGIMLMIQKMCDTIFFSFGKFFSTTVQSVMACLIHHFAS